MSKWIVFKAAGDEYGWENRKFAHSDSLTTIICEQLDYSKDEIPEKGYRPPTDRLYFLVWTLQMVELKLQLPNSKQKMNE